MKTKHCLQPLFSFLIIFLFASATIAQAQDDVNRSLSVAVNGYELDEAAAKKALASGADINWRNDAMGGETLLIAAVKSFKDSKVIRFLLHNGADLRIKDNSGKTALDWAEQYKIGKDNKGREILELLGSRPVPAATTKTVASGPSPATKTAPAAQPKGGATQNKIIAGGPSINEIKAVLENSFTTAYQNHFYGVKNKVTFEWIGGITVGQAERRLRLAQLCYPVKLVVKVTATDPRDGNTSTVVRGTEAEIGGYRKTEIFCFFKNGFGQWEYGTYEL